MSNPTPGFSTRLFDDRQREAHRRLAKLCPGVADMYEDACRIMASERSLRSSSLVVAHLCREIESALHELVPSADPLADASEAYQCEKCGSTVRQKHRDRIRRAMGHLSIPEESDEGAAWLYLVGKLHKHAHRTGLDPARALNDEFDRIWQALNKTLSAVLLQVELNYARFHKQIDEMFR